MTSPVQQPQWSGLPLDFGWERHILPLYEDDRIHKVPGANCPCQPTVENLWDETKLPPKRLYRHKVITRNHQ